MGYKSLEECVVDLERHGHLIRIKEEVDPYLEMAAIHMRVFDVEGPALYFENIKGSKFPAVSNLFGTLDRSKFMFRDTLEHVKKLTDVKMDPSRVLKKTIRLYRIIDGRFRGTTLEEEVGSTDFTWKNDDFGTTTDCKLADGWRGLRDDAAGIHRRCDQAWYYAGQLRYVSDSIVR